MLTFKKLGSRSRAIVDFAVSYVGNISQGMCLL